MGLRINTNYPARLALTHLTRNDRALTVSLERLATGIRARRSREDPADVPQADTLRSELESLRRLGENISEASGLVATADAAIEEMLSLVEQIQGSIVAVLNSATSGTEAVAAEQAAVDRALDAMARIAGSTRFHDIPLLNGSSGFQVSGVGTGSVLDLRLFRMRFNPVSASTTVAITVSTAPAQATFSTGGVAGGSVRLRVMGPLGTEDFVLMDGAGAADVELAVHRTREITGVYASGGAMFTQAFGEAAFIRVELVSGAGTFSGAGGLTVGQVAFTRGVDAEVRVFGETFSGQGNVVSVLTPYFYGDVILNPVSAAPGTTSITVWTSGLRLQPVDSPNFLHESRIGIPNLTPSALGMPEVVVGSGTIGGFLSSLATGQGNDLFKDPGRGLAISRDAIGLLTRARGFLGTVVADELEPLSRAHSVAAENIAAGLSTLVDANMAEEAAELAKRQVLFQSGIAVLGQAAALPQQILQLLQ